MSSWAVAYPVYLEQLVKQKLANSSSSYEPVSLNNCPPLNQRALFTRPIQTVDIERILVPVGGLEAIGLSLKDLKL
jgi:hypothetical protein